MKNIFFTLLMVIVTFAVQAQNKNVTKETKTTKVTVNDGNTPKQVVRTENVESSQDIRLKDEDSKKLNKEVMETPVRVTSSTTISGTNIPAQEIGQSNYYEFNGKRYQFVSDKLGYRITSPDNKEHGVLRRTSNNNYIYKTGTTTSIGHFDSNGNFVVETYDTNSDGVTKETYTIIKNTKK